MKRLLIFLVCLLPSLALAQQIRTNFPPPYTLTASPALILSVGQFDEYNVLLTASGTITFSVPVISNATILFRVNTCQNGTGGFTPTFTALGSTTIVNRAPTITTLTPNACDTENWSYRQETNQLILESVSLKTGSGMVLSGTGPQIGQYPAGTGTIIGPATVSGDATIAQGGAVTVTGSNTFTGHGTTPTITNFSVNGVFNPLTYSGADLGAKINAVIAANPNGGEILIPAGTYSYSTTIQCPINGNAPFLLQGAGRGQGEEASTNGATTLLFTGSGDAINQEITNSSKQNSNGCVLRDFLLDGSGAGSSAVGFRFGGTVYSAVNNVEIQSFQGAGIEIEDAASMFTERYDLDATLWRNQIGLYYHCDTNCSQSFEHGKVNLWLNVLTQSGIFDEGIKADSADVSHPALVENVDFNVDGNVEGIGSGGILFHAAPNSTFNGNTYAIYPECDQSSCIRVKLDSTATFAGQFSTGLATNNPWTDLIAAGGTFVTYGYSANNNAGGFSASVNGVLNAQSFGARGDGIYSGDGLRSNDGTTTASGTTLSSTTGHFTNGSLVLGSGTSLVGDQVYIEGAGSAGGLYVGAVTAVNSATSITITPSTPTAVAGTAIYVIGYDNTAALNTFAAEMRNTGALPSSISGFIPTGVYLEHGVDFAGTPGIILRGAGAGLMAAGSGVNQGGTLLLCLKPTPTMGNSGKLCHDFSGDISSTISDLTLANGIDDVTSGGSGSVNALFDRTPAGSNFFGIVNQIQNVVFRSYGGPNAYGMVNYGYEQTDYLDDIFNWDTDTAKAIYLSNLNTPGFTSPRLGALFTPPNSTTVMTFMGGKWQVSSNGCPSTPSNRSVLCCGPSGVGTPLNPASSCSVEGQTSGEQEQAAVTFDGNIAGINFIGGFFRLNGPDDVLFKDTGVQVQNNISITGMDGEEGTTWTSGSTLTANNRMVDFQGDMNAWSVVNDLMSFNTNVARASTATDWKARNIVGSNFQTYNTTSFANPEWQCTGSPPNAVDTYFGNANNSFISCSVDTGIEHNFSGLVGAATFFGRGTPGISGGGALTTHANSTTGEITNIAATGNVLTPGYSCANVGGNVVGALIDTTNGLPISVTARSSTTVTFSGTATHTVDYSGMGCG